MSGSSENDNRLIPPVARSVRDQARRIGLGRSYLYEQMNAGALPYVKIGRRRLITDSDADDFLAAHHRSGRLPAKAA